jgi:hypothetical protein
LAVAPRGHYCSGGGIGHFRVFSESSAIKPSIPVASLANDLAASLFSRTPTGFVGATAARADCAASESQTRRAAAMASEGGKSAGPPSAKPVAKRAGQQNPISEANSQQPTPAHPQRLGLADLKASAQARRARLVAAK